MSDSYLNAIGTAVPPHRLPQARIAEFMASALNFDEIGRRRLRALYRSTRIDYRHTVLPDYGRQPGEFEFYPNTPDLEPFPTVSQRMAVFRREALPLAVRAVKACLKPLALTTATGFDEPEDDEPDYTSITHLITVSCTGMYAPGLDIDLINALGMPTTVQRTAINFMGCYGAFNGLKTADTICRAFPDARVLVVCVELCTLHFQKKPDDDFLLSNALFADGAAAVLVEATPRTDGPSLALRSFFCDLYPDGAADMAWHVADFGFEMTLSSYIPKLVRQGIGALVERLLAHAGLDREAVNLYAMHPGGKAILEAIEQALGLSSPNNRFAYDVLREYGNMSSATVLFVLEKLLAELTPADAGRSVLSCAFGPGLTLESAVMEVVF
ncbi:MAG: type III polyketide synthase [Cytophagaceae bacterium]|nr:type III polyketide synthase [Cytophagaceae bacterium]